MPSELTEIDPALLPPPLPPVTQMKLMWLDLHTLRAGLTLDDDLFAQLQQIVLGSAQILAGPDRVEARVRMLAKAIAITRAKVLVLESLLDTRLAARDEQGVRLVSKVLDGANRRLVALLAEHRLACEAERRPSVTVAVGQAGAVNVMTAVGAR